jgi:predicted DNA-binding transcriptional regulator
MNENMFMDELNNEINRRKKINTLYNRYIKETGALDGIRLYEDPAEVEFTPLTTELNVDYTNDLVEKLLKVMGRRNYERVIDLVHNKLNEHQIREVATNFDLYNAFLQQYLKKKISYERFQSEFLDYINKNTAPEQILDKINNLQMINGTGTVITDPTTESSTALYPDNNNNFSGSNPMKTPAKTPARRDNIPTESTDTANVVDSEDDQDENNQNNQLAMDVNKNIEYIETTVLKNESVDYFFGLAGRRGSNNQKIQNFMKREFTAKNLQTQMFTGEIGQQLKRMFLDEGAVKQDDIFSGAYNDNTRLEVQYAYTNQVIECLEPLTQMRKFDKNYVIEIITAQFDEDRDNLKPAQLEMKYKLSTELIDKKRRKKTMKEYTTTLKSMSIDDLLEQYTKVTHSFQPSQKEPAIPANDTSNVIDNNNAIDGSGLKSNKYYIDKRAFGRGILAVRYRKNRHLLQDMKPVQMSNELKRKIENQISIGGSGKNVDIDNIKLNPEEQRVYNQLLKKYGHEVDDTEQRELDNKFNTLIGEISAGNDNKLLKQELRSMLIYSMKTGAISRSDALDYFLQFSL